jgi:hypothetical protein
MKKYFIVFLMVFLLLGSTNVLGVTQQSGIGGVTPQAYQMITGGNCVIIDNGDGTLSISGYTSTAYAIDQIGLKLNLQYLSNGSWYTLNTYSFAQSNYSYVSGEKRLGVTKGFYYRVVGEHTAIDGGISEQGQTYSTAVYIP